MRRRIRESKGSDFTGVLRKVDHLRGDDYLTSPSARAHFQFRPVQFADVEAFFDARLAYQRQKPIAGAHRRNLVLAAFP